MWRPQLEALEAAGVIAAAPDLPGHGARHTEAFTLDEALDTIDETIDTLPGEGPVVLVGLSLGGYLAMEFAGRRRERIDGLIAMACTTPPIAFGLDAYRAVGEALTRSGQHALRMQRLAQTLVLGPEGADDFLAGGLGLTALHDAVNSVATLDPIDAIRRAAAADLPVWFVSGQFDQMRLGERRFRLAAPDAWHTIVPYASHVVSLANPGAVSHLLVRTARAVAGAS